MLEGIQEFLLKVKTVASSIVVKLTVVGTVLTTALAFASQYADLPVVGQALPYLTVAAGVLATLTRIVAHVAEVPTDIVGLSPVSTFDVGTAFVEQAIEDESSPEDVEFWTADRALE